MSETYEVRRYRTVTINNTQADAYFAGAVDLLATNNGGGDVACSIEWSRNDDVEAFDTGDGLIASAAELREMMDQEGNIKVVNALDFCGGVANVRFAACAETPGEDIVVEDIDDSALAAVVWAHEYGHNKGLRHRNDPGALMHENATIGNSRINAAECTRFQARFDAAKQTGECSHGCDHTQLERPADVRDFVRQFFIHGLRWDIAVEYDVACVPVLLDMLEDPKEEKHWMNAVKVLCLIGDDRAVAPLVALLERGEDTITVDHFSAKRAVLMHIGSLVRKSGNQKALALLLDSVSERGGWRSRVKWKNPFHGGSAEQDVHVTKVAAWGLAYSGDPAAAEALTRLEKRPNKSKGLTSVVKEALVAHKIIAEQGTLAFYQKSR